MANHSTSAHVTIQLVYEVHLFAQWHTFPLTSKHIYTALKHAPSSVHAEYLIARHAEWLSDKANCISILTKILRYPICTEPVLDAFFRLADPDTVPKSRIELPRRLFRPLSPRENRKWTERDKPLPFLRYLYDHPRIPPPDPDYSDGYALTRAVAAGFVPLVRFLLEHGASPRCKEGMAVHAAIRRKNLPLVKMLIEPDNRPIRMEDNRNDESCVASGRKKGKRNREDEGDGGRRRSAKKRKIEDRVPVTQAMLQTAVKCDARDIVRYFMEEKACMPDMQTVRMMRH